MVPVDFIFYISLLKCLNLRLILGVKVDGHRGTWTECLYVYQILETTSSFFCQVGTVII